MEHYTNYQTGGKIPNSVLSQSCVRAILKAKLSSEIKKEMQEFISRNTLKDCKKVPPNDLKAHLIKTARKFGVSRAKLHYLKNLFKAKIGFMGYYLDKGRLRKV